MEQISLVLLRSEMFIRASITQLKTQLNAQEQLNAGVTPGLVRLSIGLENLGDIKADLEIGFAAAQR